MSFLPSLLACILVAFGPVDKLETGFVPMFDGKTLDGWKQVGGSAKYHVDADEIVGTVDPAMKGNAFLRSEKTYGDFILKLDLKLDIPGNSGIQFRSHERVEKNGATRVFGYQAEVDPSPRAWSGGLYDEARRGWLQDLKDRPEARKAFKIEDWNAYEIEARGPHIKITLNGVACVDYLDTADLEGFIALQVHVGKAGVIRWKNVRIKDLGQSKWKPLFDGKTLEGWEPKGEGRWLVEGGTIVGANTASETNGGLLVSKQEFGDFAVRLKFESKAGHSGLCFPVDESGSRGERSFRAVIDSGQEVGGLTYKDPRGPGPVVLPNPEVVKKWIESGGWNELSVITLGDRVVVQVNGFKSVEIVKSHGRKRGKLALQVLGGQNVDVRFKDIEVVESGPSLP